MTGFFFKWSHYRFFQYHKATFSHDLNPLSFGIKFLSYDETIFP